MARLLMAALRLCGHEVGLVSSLRSYLRDPEDIDTYKALLFRSEKERRTIDAQWRATGKPDLWVCYHPYHKSPDLLGPELCRAHGVPWITIEASQSPRRSVGLWADLQKRALESVRHAQVNIALTQRDMDGLHEFDPGFQCARLAPFLDASDLLAVEPNPRDCHLVTVAMMRPGDKFESYTILAKALARLIDKDWRLIIVGDGPARPDVEALFQNLPTDRISWAGQRDAAGVRDVLTHAAVFLWPGCGEAFGLAYLEAQAAGVPVVAQNVAGVPEVVQDQVTGLLTPKDDVKAFSDAIRRVLDDSGLRSRLGSAAREIVRRDHSLEGAAKHLGQILDRYVWPMDL